jgi:Cu(I)/Ag(I) efflux system membrane fusion protein
MNRIAITVVVAIALGSALGTGYWLGSRGHAPAVSSTPVITDAKRPMYWFDPMKPDTHFDKPGKSPFMDMELVPKYADAESAGSVRVDATTMQNLGMRTALVETGVITRGAHVPGTIGWDLREASVVSARADGVIDRLYVRAPFERVKAGQPLAELIAPEWNAAAQEYLALGRANSADARALHAAAGERLHALGMDEGQIRGLGRGGPRIVLRAPSDGVVSTLDVREGQRVNAGVPIMTLNGSRSVWLEAAIPQGQSGGIVAGTAVKATVSAWPGRTFSGHVEAMLPEVDAATRTQRARIVLDNTGGDLAPGMFAELQLQSTAGHAYPLVPDEALIETGDAARVIVADDTGHYRPVAVRTGASSGGKTEILAGLKGGERVVVSGQFLIDSEASLSGALKRLPAAPAPASDQSGTQEPKP